MTNKEKVICEAYTGFCFLTGDEREDFYEYVARICGRPVYTHELPELQTAIKTLSKEDFVRVCRGDFDGTKGLFMFSSRLKLAKKYEKWIKANGVQDCAFSVITYLHANGLLNVDKAERHIKEG